MDQTKQTDRLLVSANEAKRLLSVSNTTFYRLVNAGDLVAVKIGRRTYVPRESLEAFVDKLREDAAA